MVLSFVGLSGATREMAFRTFAQDRVRAGFRRNVIANQAKAAGFGLERSTMLRIGREYEGRAVAAPRMQGVGRKRVPGMGLYAETDWKLSKRFETIFEVSGTDSLTGEAVTRNVSLLSDERLVIEQAEAELLETIRLSTGPSGMITPISIKPVEGLIRASPPFIEEG